MRREGRLGRRARVGVDLPQALHGVRCGKRRRARVRVRADLGKPCRDLHRTTRQRRRRRADGGAGPRDCRGVPERNPRRVATRREVAAILHRGEHRKRGRGVPTQHRVTELSVVGRCGVNRMDDMEGARIPGAGHRLGPFAPEVEAMDEVQSLPQHGPRLPVGAARGTHARGVHGVGCDGVDLPVVVHARAELGVRAELVTYRQCRRGGEQADLRGRDVRPAREGAPEALAQRRRVGSPLAPRGAAVDDTEAHVRDGDDVMCAARVHRSGVRPGDLLDQREGDAPVNAGILPERVGHRRRRHPHREHQKDLPAIVGGAEALDRRRRRIDVVGETGAGLQRPRRTIIGAQVRTDLRARAGEVVVVREEQHAGVGQVHQAGVKGLARHGARHNRDGRCRARLRATVNRERLHRAKRRRLLRGDEARTLRRKEDMRERVEARACTCRPSMHRAEASVAEGTVPPLPRTARLAPDEATCAEGVGRHRPACARRLELHRRTVDLRPARFQREHCARGGHRHTRVRIGLRVARARARRPRGDARVTDEDAPQGVRIVRGAHRLAPPLTCASTRA